MRGVRFKTRFKFSEFLYKRNSLKSSVLRKVMIMDMKEFLEKADGVAFWLMMFLYLALAAYFYIFMQKINYILLFLFVIGLIVSKTAWTIFAWRRPSSIEVEKAESVAFWMMSLISLVVLTLEYVTTKFFDHHVLFILVAVFLTKYMMLFLSYIGEKV